MSDKNMEKLAAEARRAYKREWTRKNPDKVKEYQRRFWLKKAMEREQEQRAE